MNALNSGFGFFLACVDFAAVANLGRVIVGMLS